MAPSPAHVGPQAAHPGWDSLPPSLRAHTPEQLIEVASECWDKWLEGTTREVVLRRRLRAQRATIQRLRRRLRLQYANAHHTQEHLLPS